jgi:hypothetical protein
MRQPVISFYEKVAALFGDPSVVIEEGLVLTFVFKPVLKF